MQHRFLFISAICAFTAVAFGAFGAHGLKAVLSTDMLTVYKTAVTYQMWHAIGLAIISLSLTQYQNSRLLIYSSWLMLTGIVLFSGSLYLLSLSGLKWLGMITPFGGLSFLSAWALFALVIWQQKLK